MAVCLSKGNLVVILNEQVSYTQVKLTNAEKFYPSSDYPACIQPTIEKAITINDNISILGLVQTEGTIYSIEKGIDEEKYSKKLLFNNYFVDLIFYPKLRLILAINRFHHLSGYKINGKYLGNFEGNVKAMTI